jgi:phospholipid transport system substrate-binding protein
MTARALPHDPDVRGPEPGPKRVSADLEANVHGRLLRTLALPVLMLAVAGVRPAVAGPPTDELKARVERVIQLLEDKSLDSERRRAEIRKVADEIFDFQEIAKRALGRHWNQRSPQEREEFVGLFSELLEHAYLSKIEQQYSGERVSYTGESIDGDQASVRTKIVTRQGTDVPIEYRMLRAPGGWRVYDVVVEGVSLVANYRTQFNRIIETASYSELLSRLRSRAVPPTPTPRGGGRT